MSLRDTILQAKGLSPVAVPCPEWGEGVVVWIHPLSGAQRDALEEENLARSAAADYAPGASRKDLLARAIVRAARDASGQPVFRLEDVDALMQKDARVLDRLWRIVDRLSAVSEEEIEALMGKPAGTPGDASSSGSAGSSAS